MFEFSSTLSHLLMTSPLHQMTPPHCIHRLWIYVTSQFRKNLRTHSIWYLNPIYPGDINQAHEDRMNIEWTLLESLPLKATTGRSQMWKIREITTKRFLIDWWVGSLACLARLRAMPRPIPSRNQYCEHVMIWYECQWETCDELINPWSTMTEWNLANTSSPTYRDWWHSGCSLNHIDMIKRRWKW